MMLTTFLPVADHTADENVHYTVQGTHVLVQGFYDANSSFSIREPVTCINRMRHREDVVHAVLQVDAAIEQRVDFYDSIPFTVLCSFESAPKYVSLNFGTVEMQGKPVVPIPKNKFCTCSKLYGHRSDLHLRVGASYEWIHHFKLHGAYTVMYLIGSQMGRLNLSFVSLIVQYNADTLYVDNTNYLGEVESIYLRANENCSLRCMHSCEWVMNIDVDEYLVTYVPLPLILDRYSAFNHIGIAKSDSSRVGWKNLFRPRIDTRVDAHGSYYDDDDFVLADASLVCIHHNKLFLNASSNLERIPEPFDTLNNPTLGSHSLYQIPFLQGTEAATLSSRHGMF